MHLRLLIVIFVINIPKSLKNSLFCICYLKNKKVVS